ncbi:MAG: hypothetical protein JWR84_3108 [Caulobacter sp.]|nr:hypothetical protein [Caulobacter sp.]
MVDRVYGVGALGAAFGRRGAAGLEERAGEARLGALAAVAIHERVR